MPRRLWSWLFGSDEGDEVLTEFERRTGYCLEPPEDGRAPRLVRKADLDGQTVSPAKVRGGRVVRRER